MLFFFVDGIYTVYGRTIYIMIVLVFMKSDGILYLKIFKTNCAKSIRRRKKKQNSADDCIIPQRVYTAYSRCVDPHKLYFQIFDVISQFCIIDTCCVCMEFAFIVHTNTTHYMHMNEFIYAQANRVGISTALIMMCRRFLMCVYYMYN